MRHQNDIPARFMDGLIDAADPHVADRIVPATELDAATILAFAFPQALPMIGALIPKAGNSEDERAGLVRHGSSLAMWRKWRFGRLRGIRQSASARDHPS
jgi:hypothetical protein